MQLDALFKPKSIAVIGASDKPTPGRRIIASLDRLGFAGRVYPVNPNYAAVLNRTCYPSVADLPEAPDIGVFCLGRHPRNACERLGKDWEERRAGYFRHLFAFRD